MNRPEIIHALEEEIGLLRQVRQLLQGSSDLRPALAKLVGNTSASRPRTISLEGRRRIVEAQKRRWARQKNGSQPLGESPVRAAK